MTNHTTTVDKTLSVTGKVTDKNVESITSEGRALALDVFNMPGSSKTVEVKKEEDEDATKLKDALTDLKSTYSQQYAWAAAAPHDGELLFLKGHIFRFAKSGGKEII